MNNEDVLTNYLLIIKSTMEVYVHGTLESSNKDVKDTLRSILSKTIDHQERTYNIMVSGGIYTVENIAQKDIKKIYSKHKKSICD